MRQSWACGRPEPIRGGTIPAAASTRAPDHRRVAALAHAAMVGGAMPYTLKDKLVIGISTRALFHICAGHARHHIRLLASRYDLPVPAGEVEGDEASPSTPAAHG